MVGAIVDQVAALTEAAEVTEAVVGRIVIEVRGGEHDARRPQPHHLLEVGPAGEAAALVAPGGSLGIEPSPVRQAPHGGAVRPAAALAHAMGALEADAPTELAPVRGVETAELSPDRHGRSSYPDPRRNAIELPGVVSACRLPVSEKMAPGGEREVMSVTN
jgi:hypothetical protein